MLPTVSNFISAHAANFPVGVHVFAMDPAVKQNPFHGLHREALLDTFECFKVIRLNHAGGQISNPANLAIVFVVRHAKQSIWMNENFRVVYSDGPNDSKMLVG